MFLPIWRARAENGPANPAKFVYFSALVVERESTVGQRVPKLRVAHDGGVTDAVDRVDHVAHTDGV